MDLDAIFSEMESRSTPDDSVLCVIDDNLRIVTVPSSGMVFGVEKDKDVNRIDFEMDRYYRDNDMSEFSARIYYQNAKGNKNYSTVTDLSFTEDKITFSWTVPAYALMYEGTIRFAVNFIKTSGSVVEKAFNTTIASANCLIGLYIDTQIPEKEFEDYLTHLKNEIKGYSDVQLAVIEDAKTEALTGIDDAEEEALLNIKQASPALPAITDSDFGKSVTVKLDASGLELSGPYAPIEVAVRPTVSGNPAVAEDSIAWNFQELKIYGKSTQAGTPSPENQVPIVSAGDGGSVATTICGSNLLDLSQGKNGTNQGVTFTKNLDGSYQMVGTATGAAGNVWFLGHYSNQKVLFWLQPGTYGAQDCALFYNGRSIVDSVNPNTKFVLTKKTPVGGVRNPKLSTGETYNKTIYPAIFVGENSQPWEPYTGQSFSISTPNGLPGIPVTSGGNFTDVGGQQWVCDEIDFARGVYVQRAGKLSISDFTLTSMVHPGTTGCRFAAATPNRIILPNQSALCNYFPYVAMPMGSYGTEGNYIATDETARVFIRITESISLENFHQLYPDLVAYYQLETPVETPLSEEEIAAYRAMTTYDGTTVVSTAEPVAGIEVSYVADTQKYIDKKIEEAIGKLSAAQQGEETNVSL